MTKNKKMWLAASKYEFPAEKPKASVNTDLANKVFKAPSGTTSGKAVAVKPPPSTK